MAKIRSKRVSRIETVMFCIFLYELPRRQTVGVATPRGRGVQLTKCITGRGKGLQGTDIPSIELDPYPLRVTSHLHESGTLVSHTVEIYMGNAKLVFVPVQGDFLGSRERLPCLAVLLWDVTNEM